MHRFDGLDLLTLLVGLSLLGYVAWRLWCRHVAGDDPEPAGRIPGAHRYWAGVDLGNEHAGLSVYDSWEQKFLIKPWPSDKSKVEAQFLLYQTLTHPDEPITYIANEDQAERVFAEAQKLHDDVMKEWIDSREPGQQIPRRLPPEIDPSWRDNLGIDASKIRFIDVEKFPPYNWADDPDA